MNLLKISNFYKSYKDSNFSIENFNLDISGGEVVGLIGNNGSGKSSIINSLVGNRQYETGEFEFLNHKWEPNSHYFKENLGVAFDNNRLSKELNIKQLNIVLKNLYSTWNTSSFFNLIDKFNLPKKQIIKNFSRGMLMKLSIAVAMSHDTKLLILDESTSG
ncbi:ATP-binding cassette domain-containing protein, partial [Staphylococcus gallinarum]|uniref:ATP-binding cassette domain-containing protein n=1 Tax=Staphylococcus gallinarum TaxID=1293 RepID=UPI000E68A4B9